jgi:hypothetical protein
MNITGKNQLFFYSLLIRLKGKQTLCYLVFIFYTLIFYTGGVPASCAT